VISYKDKDSLKDKIPDVELREDGELVDDFILPACLISKRQIKTNGFRYEIQAESAAPNLNNNNNNAQTGYFNLSQVYTEAQIREPVPHPSVLNFFAPLLPTDSFVEVRLSRKWFVVKSEYLLLLEAPTNERIIFRRPTRFGKSMFLRLVESYYDIALPDTLRRSCFKNLNIIEQKFYLHFPIIQLCLIC
jgi:hypothetical protein